MLTLLSGSEIGLVRYSPPPPLSLASFRRGHQASILTLGLTLQGEHWASTTKRFPLLTEGRLCICKPSVSAVPQKPPFHVCPPENSSSPFKAHLHIRQLRETWFGDPCSPRAKETEDARNPFPWCPALSLGHTSPLSLISLSDHSVDRRGHPSPFKSAWPGTGSPGGLDTQIGLKGAPGSLLPET